MASWGIQICSPFNPEAPENEQKVSSTFVLKVPLTFIKSSRNSRALQAWMLLSFWKWQARSMLTETRIMIRGRWHLACYTPLQVPELCCPAPIVAGRIRAGAHCVSLVLRLVMSGTLMFWPLQCLTQYEVLGNLHEIWVGIHYTNFNTKWEGLKVVTKLCWWKMTGRRRRLMGTWYLVQ